MTSKRKIVLAGDVSLYQDIDNNWYRQDISPNSPDLSWHRIDTEAALNELFDSLVSGRGVRLILTRGGFGNQAKVLQGTGVFGITLDNTE